MTAPMLDSAAVLTDAELNAALNAVPYCWAVQTDYVGPTDRLGSRVRASFAGESKKRATISYDPALSPAANGLKAAYKFLAALDNGHKTSYQLSTMASTSKGYLFIFR